MFTHEQVNRGNEKNLELFLNQSSEPQLRGVPVYAHAAREPWTATPARVDGEKLAELFGEDVAVRERLTGLTGKGYGLFRGGVIGRRPARSLPFASVERRLRRKCSAVNELGVKLIKWMWSWLDACHGAERMMVLYGGAHRAEGIPGG